MGAKMAKTYTIPKLPLGIDLETKKILKQVNLANKALAELKGHAHSDMYPKYRFRVHVDDIMYPI